MDQEYVSISSPLDLMRLDLGDNFIPGRHLELIDEYLMRLLDEEDDMRKLMVVLPPRHGKSALCSTYFPAYVQCTQHNKSIIQISYAKGLVEDFTRESRDIVLEYGEYPLDDSLQRQDEYKLARPYKGRVLGRGVLGGITGKGAEILILDDLVSGSDVAINTTQKKKLHNWYEGTLTSRLHKGGIILSIGTRWAPDDVMGKIMEDEDDWTVIDLPVYCDDPDNDLLGRKEGEVLWPEHLDKDYIEERRRSMGEYWFSCEYMGRPVPFDGDVCNPEDFGSFARTPSLRDQKTRVMTVDLAISEGKYADSTVITILDYDKGGFYVMKQHGGHWNSTTALNEISKMYNYFHPDSLYIEDVGFQRSYIEHLLRMGVPAMPFRPPKDGKSNRNPSKEVKIMQIIPYIQGGLVYLHTTEDFTPLKEELRAFPNGSHDDYLDSLYMAIIKSGGGNPYTEGDPSKYYTFSTGYKAQEGRPKSVFMSNNPYSSAKSSGTRRK